MSRPVDNIIKLFGSRPLRLHEIDIENLVGNGKPTKEQIGSLRKLYACAVQATDHDLVVIGAGPQNRKAVIEGWPGAIYLFKKGTDGADEALVDFYNQIEDKSIFTHIFVGSGDNKFGEVIKSAKSSGIATTLVLGAGKKSRKLDGHNSIFLENGK